MISSLVLCWGLGGNLLPNATFIRCNGTALIRCIAVRVWAKSADEEVAKYVSESNVLTCWT